MAMQISGNYGHDGSIYAERVKEKQASTMEEKAREEEKKTDSKTEPKGLNKLSDPRDEFIRSEKSGKESAGQHREGGNGNGKEPKVSGNNQGKRAEKCEGNTDKVEREIKKLKEKKQQLEAQIQSASASGDEKKIRELEKKLAQVEQELRQKDNDTYRRRHTVFS